MNIESLNTLLDKAKEARNAGELDEADHCANGVLSALNSLMTNVVISPSGLAQVREGEILRTAAMLLLSDTARQRGDYERAIELAQHALLIAEQNSLGEHLPIAWNALGTVYAQLALYDKALEFLEKALFAHEALGALLYVARVLGNIGLVYNSRGNYEKSLEYCMKALSTYKALGEESGVALSMGNIGLVYNSLGNYDKALEYYSNALSAHEALGEQSAVARDTGNIGIVYYALEIYDKALEFFGRALSVHEAIGEIGAAARVIGNIGNVHSTLGDYDTALEYFGKAVSAHEKLGEQSFSAAITGDIGNVYSRLGDYDKALECYGKALSVHVALGEESRVASVTGDIGILYSQKNFEEYDPSKAEEYLLRAIAMNEALGAQHNLYESHKAIAELYEQEDRWKDFAVHYKKYHAIAHHVQSEEAKKQAEKHDTDRKLTAERARAQATEELLHKTLPKSIADRVIQGEKRIADHFESVSVLFADIVGFTKLSAAMPPEVILVFMNFIIEHFDTLAEHYGCERIKTIGDGYMAVCGAPLRYPNHTERLARMALDMLEDIELPEEILKHLPKGTQFHLRIGLHCGEITAGVIGTGKLAYDIYGDAVNTASRMESHGEAGKIHVSEEFMHALSLSSIRSFKSFHFQERSEMEIKGKGKMKTYFLEKS